LIPEQDTAIHGYHQRYTELYNLRRWRFMMAHLNEHIDVYFKVHYKVEAYHLNTLYTHSKLMPWKPYRTLRRQRLQNARRACLQAIAH
jgi:hypothetical protein